MFARIASAFRANRTSTAPCIVDSAVQAALRSEVEDLFRSDMDSFTRLAMERRARKAHRAMAFAA